MNIRGTYGVITTGYFCAPTCYMIKNVPYLIPPSLNGFILIEYLFIFFLNQINYVTVKKIKRDVNFKLPVAK